MQAVIVRYDGDTDTHKAFSEFAARVAVKSQPDLRKFDCEGFSMWCRNGRYETFEIVTPWHRMSGGKYR